MIDRKQVIAQQLSAVKSALENKSGNWYQLVKSLYTDIDVCVRKKYLKIFLFTAM